MWVRQVHDSSGAGICQQINVDADDIVRAGDDDVQLPIVRAADSPLAISTASTRFSQATIHCAKPTCVMPRVAGVAVSLPQEDHEDVCALLLLNQAHRHRSPCQGAHDAPGRSASSQHRRTDRAKSSA